MKLVTVLIGLVFTFSVQANEPPATPSADAPAVQESAAPAAPVKEMKKAGKKAAKKKKKHKKNEVTH